ncbi:MAG: DEAD/DEAH box helicase family protein [Actinomycetota bacterium]
MTEPRRAVVIENPVLNSPFHEPGTHFVFDQEGITDQIAGTRRPSSFFIPIPPPKKRGKQLALQESWTSERVRENDFINQVRGEVQAWRTGGYTGITPTTRELLDHWQRDDCERRLFFCQIEAAETAIFLTEVAPHAGRQWIANTLKAANANHNPGLNRVALKMATGAGKTVVMAMLIAWQSLNKMASPQDKRFADAFLIVTPGITIRDRLRVLLPNDVHNYYRELDILAPDQLTRLGQAKIEIVNFHQLQRREKPEFKGVSTTTKRILSEDLDRFKETPAQMVRRVTRSLGNKKDVIVINDEAHHCYREKPPEEAGDREEKLATDEKREAEQNKEAARVWLTGIEAINEKLGVRTVYDLSATPFFLRGSGYPEGTLFPWVVSDFSLIDAIESGIVKIPRVPVADDQMTGAMPTFRDLWLRIRNDLPKRGRAASELTGEPILPKELEAALISLYGNYEKSYTLWEQMDPVQRGTPPVFIVVCNNTTVSKLVCDWIAGWEKQQPDGTTVVVPGKLAVFSNEENGGWTSRPNTLLIDSAQIDSGEGMSDEFKKVAAAEIEEFKNEYRARFPGRSVDEITNEDLLREVMNTVGKKDRLGENLKCVVSVSMLTEGWDANTVTHILGVRAFGTQLLCEQVVGRGLRRTSYEPNDDGMFEPEYAEVYGVPFSFIPTAGTSPNPVPPKPVHRIRAMESRAALEITFPRVIGYRYLLPSEKLTPKFRDDSHLVLSNQEVPTETEVVSIVGQAEIHTLDDLKAFRLQTVAFEIAKATLDGFFTDEDGNERPWLFPQLAKITREWLDGYLVCKGNAFPQMLLMAKFKYEAVEKVYSSIVSNSQGERRLTPIMRPYDPIGTTALVGFDSTKLIYETDPDKCHLNYVVQDSDWESNLAHTLEQMPEVLAYVKNQGLGFQIPYVFQGKQANYIPDFIIRYDDGGDEPLNLILEVSGENKKDKQAKVSTAQNQWVPAINNAGAYGRWAFIEIKDPWDAKNLIRATFPSMSKAAP